MRMTLLLKRIKHVCILRTACATIRTDLVTELFFSAREIQAWTLPISNHPAGKQRLMENVASLLGTPVVASSVPFQKYTCCQAPQSPFTSTRVSFLVTSGAIPLSHLMPSHEFPSFLLHSSPTNTFYPHTRLHLPSKMCYLLFDFFVVVVFAASDLPNILFTEVDEN